MRRIETKDVFESSVYFFMSNSFFKLRVIYTLCILYEYGGWLVLL